MLVAENIGKKFSGVTALENINLQLIPGKINAIIGENGAGKSTLMKILSGVYKEYEGQIILNGAQVRFSSPREAQGHGIAIIHQELNLIPHLSITENIFLGREITNTWGMLDKKAMQAKTHTLLAKLKISLDPDTLIIDLKVGQQQVVEIAKALLVDSQVIIMDEPTSAISDKEVKVLFEIIVGLKKENKIIVYISHKLDELFTIADCYVILRDGKVIESGAMKGMTHDSIIRKMVGREVEITRKQGRVQQDKILLAVKNLCLKNPNNPGIKTLKNISFQLYKGEILGIFGLMGAGRTELLETILGLHPVLSEGKISIHNKAQNFKSPKDAINAGITLAPEDRKKDGLVPGMDITTNICLSTLNTWQKSGLLDKKKELSLVENYINSLQIKSSSSRQLVKHLSGGNQQKVVLAKCLATNPKVLMLDEPTRGIDVNAKNEIYKMILELSAAGLGIIVVSSEIAEIMAISDRILVLSEGTITAEFNISDANEDNILKAAIPKSVPYELA